MAGIQRFVTYIYAYDDGKKTMNAGYAKMEIRGNTGRMELHFMDGSMMRGEGKLAFAYVSGEKEFLIPVGVLPIERGTGVATYAFSAENIAESGLDFGTMDGIAIVGSNQRLYLSFWKDVAKQEFRLESLVPYEVDAKSAPEEVVIESQGEAKQAEQPQVQQESQIEQETKLDQETLEDAEQESLHTMEIPVQNVFPTYNMEDVWENLRNQKEVVTLEEDIEAVQIDLKDLRELPKKYWYLGNNSFLLTGFFNHHYILLGRTNDGKWFLGVPGGCGRQERVIAPVFGFPGYCQAGVWYHILED